MYIRANAFICHAEKSQTDKDGCVCIKKMPQILKQIPEFSFLVPQDDIIVVDLVLRHALNSILLLENYSSYTFS